MQNLSKGDLLSVGKVIGKSQEDDADKRDLFVKMGDVTFITRDIKDYDAEDDEDGKKTRTKLHAQLSVPDEKDGGKRIKLDFCLNSFKQFVQTQLGIPYRYILKCPAALARDNIRHWQGAFADRDLLIRIREGEQTYARAVLGATYGRLDNTPLLGVLNRVAEEANMGVWRYDLPDHSMHVKCVLDDHTNMGTKGSPDNVHLGFHMANSETGNRAITMDIMTFRLICTNGAISLVDGERLVRQQHKGDVDLNKFETLLREKIHEVCMKQDSIFGKFQAKKDAEPNDIFEEARLVWDKFRLKRENRNLVFQLLTEKYSTGTMWDLVNAMTEAAQALSDNPDERVKMEEAAGQYMLLDEPLLIAAA